MSSDHWAKKLKAGDTVLWVTVNRVEYDSGDLSKARAEVVALARPPTKAGYIFAKAGEWGSIYADENDTRVFRRYRKGDGWASSNRSWLERDTPEARARYELDENGVDLRARRKHEAALPGLRANAKREAIFDLSPTIYETLRSIMIDAYQGRHVSKGDVVRWEAIEAEITERIKAVK